MLEDLMGTITPLIENFDPVMLLRLPLVARAVIAIVLALVGTGGIYFALAFFPKSLRGDEYFDDFVRINTKPVMRAGWILGFFLLPGNPEGGTYTLPMYLLGQGEAGMELWLTIVVRIAIFILIFAFFRGIRFQRTTGRIGGIIPWFSCIQSIGFGILALCGIEVIARILAWLESLLNPRIGSLISILLRFLFSALILLQIFLIFINALGTIFGFLTKTQMDMLERELNTDQEARRKSFFGSGGGGGSSGGGFSTSETNTSSFPETIYINGELYRLKYDSGDNADYYCPKTGNRKNIRDVDLPGYD